VSKLVLCIFSLPRCVVWPFANCHCRKPVIHPHRKQAILHREVEQFVGTKWKIYQIDKEELTMSEKNNIPNSRCKSEVHSEHLCILTEQYFHLHEAEKYRAIVEGPKFKCQFCGRTAKSDKNLCHAIEL
jgi:hypothetical protein